MVLEYNALEAGLSLAPLSLSMFVVALLAGRKAGDRSPSKIIRAGFFLLALGVAVLIPIVPRAHSGWAMAVPLLIAGCGLGLLVSQLNNYTLSPIEEERVSEAAGVNSAGGSFGLSFGLAFSGAIMLASLSLVFTHMANSSSVLSESEADKVSTQLEKNAEVLTNTHLDKLLVGQPEDVRKEIIHINTKSRPIALQIALAIPLLAALLGLLNGFRMTRLPDPEPSSAAEGMMMG
jgi:MFS family permease